MTKGPDDIPVPRLRDGWSTRPSSPADDHVPTGPSVARQEKERRDLTKALVVFLLAAITLSVFGYRSLALPAFGVTAGWAIRLYFTQKKIERLREKR